MRRDHPCVPALVQVVGFAESIFTSLLLVPKGDHKALIEVMIQ
jgi:hypothetical protein